MTVITCRACGDSEQFRNVREIMRTCWVEVSQQTKTTCTGTCPACLLGSMPTKTIKKTPKGWKPNGRQHMSAASFAKAE